MKDKEMHREEMLSTQGVDTVPVEGELSDSGPEMQVQTSEEA